MKVCIIFFLFILLIFNELFFYYLKGVKPDKDPDEGMIVMKGFLFLTDQTLTENKRKAMSIKKRKNLPNVIPINKITPDKEENVNNATSSQSTNKDSSQKQQTEQKSKEKSTNGITNSIEKSTKSNADDKENKDSEIIQISTKEETTKTNNEPNSNDTITSNSNVLMEDASVYSTVSSTMDLYGTRTSAKSNTASIFTLTINQEQLILLRRASKEFLEKITPIDKEVWRHQHWGGKSMLINFFFFVIR